MKKFSKKSSDRLNECRQEIQDIFNEAIAIFDFSVLCGHRSKEDQDKAYIEGISKFKWPLSKHNSYPSKAIDVAPYPIDWNDIKRFFYLAGIVEGIARMKGIGIRWGGNWDGDDEFNDQTFNDYCHFELLSSDD